MNPLIECCQQNLAKSSQMLLSDEFVNENADVITYPCLNECVLCARNHFVLFEGKVISGDSSEELGEKLTKTIIDWQDEIV